MLEELKVLALGNCKSVSILRGADIRPRIPSVQRFRALQEDWYFDGVISDS